MKHFIKANYRGNILLLFLLLNLLSGCYAVESREEAIAKARTMYKAHTGDYAVIARMSDVFFKKFPGNVLDILHTTNSQRVIVRIKPDNGKPIDIDAFDISTLGLSASELENICSRSRISNIVLKHNRTIMLSDDLDAHNFEIAFIYSQDECCTDGDPESEWCEQVGPNYYVKALLIRL